MKKILQDIIIEKLEGTKFFNGMDFKDDVHGFLKELVEEFEYKERLERCKEDAEEFLERARDLFWENRCNLIEEMIGAYKEEGVEEILKKLKQLFTEEGYGLIEEVLSKCNEKNEEEILEELKWLFIDCKEELCEEFIDQCSEEVEYLLENIFTESYEFEQLSDEYKGFNCLYYYHQEMILEEPDFYDDLNIQIVNKKKYLISTDFNYLEVYIEKENAGENGYVIIKDVNTGRLN